MNDPTNTSFFIPTESPDEDYAVFTVGVSATFAHGFSAFAQFGTAQWLKNVNQYGVIAGLRKQF